MNFGISVVALGAVGAASSLFLELCPDKKMARLALSVVLVAALAFTLRSGLSDISFDFDIDYEADGSFSEACAESYCEGLSLAISDRFSISRENIEVSCVGFSPENMTAERVFVILGGKSALADHRGIKEFVMECGGGECEVSIDFAG